MAWKKKILEKLTDDFTILKGFPQEKIVKLVR